MGIIQAEYLIIQDVWDVKEQKKVDGYLKKVKKMYRELFHKCPGISNGVVTYFMTWDGSKEGWETSEGANEVREAFIKFINKTINCPEILHIKPEGEIVTQDRIDRREVKEESA